MKYLLSFILMLIPALSFAQDIDNRVIKLKGCTGFMVNDRYLVTAKHCDLGSEIVFDNTKAKLIYVTKLPDGPRIYLVDTPEGKSYESFKIASQMGESGDTVHTKGFPGGNYAVTYGKMVGQAIMEDNPFPYVNKVEMRVNPGNSGGPLINSNDEIVGICLMVTDDLSDNASYFGGLKFIQEAFNEIGQTSDNRRKPGNTKLQEIVVFSADWCGPCKVMESEISESDWRSRGLKRTLVKNVNGVWQNKELVDEFERVNGVKVSSYPTIWVRGTKQYKTGYTSGTKLSVLGWIVNIFKNIGLMLFGNGQDGEIVEPDPERFQAPIVHPPEGGLIEKTPEEIAAIDWENISIVILARKQDIGFVRGKGREILIGKAQGPISRANAEFFEGRAELFLVDERTHEAQFKSVVMAAQIDFELFYILVLVKKQDIGLKGLIASKVEKAILSKLPEGIPVEIIFERVHKDSYTKIKTALFAQEIYTDPVSDPESSKSMALLLSLSEDLKSTKAGLNELSEKDDSGLISKLGEITKKVDLFKKDQDSENESSSLYQKIMAGLLGLVGAGTATGGIRGFLARRAISKIKARIHGDDSDDV